VNEYYLTLASTAISTLAIGLFALLHNKGYLNPLRRSFFFFVLPIGLWGAGVCAMFHCSTTEAATVWSRLYTIPVIFIPVGFLNFVRHFLGQKLNRRSLVGLMLCAAVLIALDVRGSLVAPVAPKYGFDFMIQAGPTYFLLILFYLVVVIASFVILLRALREAGGHLRNQIRIAILSMAIGYTGGSANLWVPYHFWIYPLNPYSTLAIVVFVAMISYAILAHRLLEVELLARGAFGYGGTMVLLMLPFLVISIVWRGRWTGFILLVGATVWCAIFYRKVLVRVQRLVDEIIFKGRFSGRRALRQAGQESFRLSNLSELIDQSVQNIVDAFGLDRVALYFHNMTVNKYTRVAVYPKTESEQTQFSEGDDFIKSLQGSDSPLCGANPMDYAATLPLRSETNLFGFLLLGVNADGEPLAAGELENIRQMHEQALGYAHAFYEQSMMLDKMTHDNIRYAGNIRRFVFAYNMAFGTGLAEEQKEILSHIDRQAAMLEEYLSDLRQIMGILARRMQGKFTMDVYDLGEVVQEILPAERARAQLEGIQFSCNVEQGSSVYQGWGERNSIKHVIENLISNAFKFTPKGGTISLEVKDLGPHLQIAISDTGAGIPPESVSHIFDLFYQGPGREDMEKSTGIGLSIVKEIVALHKGNIDVISEPGEGTSFFIRLPSARSRAAQAA
jgi:signal transduction histidine kinase